MSSLYNFQWFVRLLSAAVLMLAWDNPTQAEEPIVLEAATPWSLDYATNYCRLVRKFGEGENEVALMLDRVSPYPTYRLTVAGKPMRARDKGAWPVQFGPYGRSKEQFAFRGSLGDYSDALIFTSITMFDEDTSGRLAVAAMDAVRWIQIGGLRRDDIRLALGDMAPVRAAMEKCVDDLVRDWGVDPQVQRTLSREPEPVGKVENWIESEDYPSAALYNGYQGALNIRLTVTAEGTASLCHIELRTEPSDFGEAACAALLRRANFAPALNEAGQPVSAIWQTRVQFVQSTKTKMRTKRGAGFNN